MHIPRTRSSRTAPGGVGRRGQRVTRRDDRALGASHPPSRRGGRRQFAAVTPSRAGMRLPPERESGHAGAPHARCVEPIPVLPSPTPRERTSHAGRAAYHRPCGQKESICRTRHVARRHWLRTSRSRIRPHRFRTTPSPPQRTRHRDHPPLSQQLCAPRPDPFTHHTHRPSRHRRNPNGPTGSEFSGNAEKPMRKCPLDTRPPGRVGDGPPWPTPSDPLMPVDSGPLAVTPVSDRDRGARVTPHRRSRRRILPRWRPTTR